MCFKGQMLKPEFRRFVFAQSVLLWLYAMNYICSLAWLAAVSRQPMTADDDATASDTSSASDDTLSSQPPPDLWALWSYTAVVIIIALTIVFVLTHFRSKILVEAEEEKEEAKAQAREDANEALIQVSEETTSPPTTQISGETLSTIPKSTEGGEPEAPHSPTSVTSEPAPAATTSDSVELKTDKPPTDKASKLAKFSDYLHKIKERRKRVWDSRRVYRQRWLDKITDMLGDSLIFMAAAGFTTAVQYSFPNSTENYVLASWVYAFGLLLLCSFVQTAVSDKANAKADEVDEEVKQNEEEEKKLERPKSVAGEVLDNLLQVPLMTKKKLFNQKVVKATWETLAGYLQYTQAYLIALGFTNAVLYSLKADGDSSASVGGAWAYLIVMLMLVSGILVLFEKKGIRKRLDGNPAYCARWKHECSDLTAASIHLMACFAIPYTVALTMNASTSSNLYILFGYAIAITIICSIIIVWVQILLGEARERFVALKKKRAEEALIKAMSSSSEPSAKEDFRASIKKFRENRPIISFLRGYEFQLKASKIVCRGLGLTVAYAWDALLVTFVLSANNEYDNWTLWIYAIVFTFITSVVVITVTTSKWMESAQSAGDEGDDPKEGEEHAEGVGSIQTKKKSKLPGLAFQDGEEDDLLDNPEDK